MASKSVTKSARGSDQRLAANCLPFPRSKKRGPKRRSGPCADIVKHPSAFREAPPASPALDDAICRLAQSMRSAKERQDERDQRRFLAWTEGRKPPEDEFVAASKYAIGTDHFGEGPVMFRWAVESVRAPEVLRPSQAEEALRLAVGQLNAVGQLLRLGGLRACTDGIEGGGDFAAHALADLGRTLRRLSMFGAVCRPVGHERELLCEAKASFEAACQWPV